MSRLTCAWAAVVLILAACGDSAPDRDVTADARVQLDDAGLRGDTAVARDAAYLSVDAASLDADASDARRSDAAAADGGSASTADASAQAACLRYVEASCERLHRCNGSNLDACLRYRSECPDYMFSPGSTRTANETAACALDWANFSCGDIEAGRAPSCASAGTRSAGESCAYASQCGSLYCTAGETSCGMCAARIAIGQPCAAPFQLCEFGSGCLGGSCMGTFPEEPNGPKGANEPCGSVCEDGYACLDDASSSTGKRCLQPPLGSHCGSTAECASNAGCVEGTCAVLPAVDEPCQSQSVYGATHGRCAPDAYCDTNERCVTRLPLGANCSDLIAACAAGLACWDAASGRVCRRLRREGESCSEPNDRCGDYLACSAGVCVIAPQDLRGNFAHYCAP